MRLKKLSLHGFKSFANKSDFVFDRSIAAIVGPNGSGKSNVVESIRFVLGEQSMKSLRGGSSTDLIFKGSGEARSMNRAAVSITFDNSDRVFSMSSIDNAKISLDFDEITLSREIYSDGASKYLVNGHEVRLKDVMEVIASVNIGASGHHIISQGEADRLLNTNVKERRHMLEDALGLKIYQYRIKESERKLDKTLDNLKESQTLRREIAPHLRFLQKQVEKIQKAKDMRTELYDRYMSYLSTQEAFLKAQKEQFGQEREQVNFKLVELKHQLDEYRSQCETRTETPEEQELKMLETERQNLARQKEELSRKIGRVEGMIEIAESSTQKKAPQAPGKASVRISLDELETVMGRVDADIDNLASLEGLDDIRAGLEKLRASLRDFVASKKEAPQADEPVDTGAAEKLAALQVEYTEMSQTLQSLLTQEKEIEKRGIELRTKIAEQQKDMQGREQKFFALSTQSNELQSRLNIVTLREEGIDTGLRTLQEEIDEAVALLGEDIWKYQEGESQHDFNNVQALDLGAISKGLEEERRTIERLKIKIEEIGGGSGGDVMDEYEQTLERDQFLEREITDLQNSMASLHTVISDLKAQLQREFEVGIKKINTQFQVFFETMFGGGSAKLALVDIEKRRKKKVEGEEEFEEIIEEDEGPREQGIDIAVKLPRKKVQDLQMLSGGERSLTSIALLFALSQVNPPPFLVLDETDAALDEANSKKYGDMIENLAKVSQLIVVTHNRETMSRADILYGVTIGSDHSSQLLSVKFDEALEYAK